MGLATTHPVVSTVTWGTLPMGALNVIVHFVTGGVKDGADTIDTVTATPGRAFSALAKAAQYDIRSGGLDKHAHGAADRD